MPTVALAQPLAVLEDCQSQTQLLQLDFTFTHRVQKKWDGNEDNTDERQCATRPRNTQIPIHCRGCVGSLSVSRESTA